MMELLAIRNTLMAILSVVTFLPSGTSAKSSCLIDGTGGACKGSYYAANPQDEYATWCADKDGTCKSEGGEATVWYGGALSWYKITLQDGEQIRCNANGWKKKSNQECGCDPAPALQKWCFKLQDYDPDQEFCCQGTWKIFGQSEMVIPTFQGDDKEDVIEKIRDYTATMLSWDLNAKQAALADFYNKDADDIAHDIFNQRAPTLCMPCWLRPLSAARSGPLTVDNHVSAAVSEPSDNTFSFDIDAWFPLIATVLVLAICAMLLYLCIEWWRSGKPYQVVHVVDTDCK